jgi:VWFA-related protein
VGPGRAELARALSRIRPGESPFEPWVLEPLTEWEAYQMVTGKRECTRCLLAQQVMTAWQDRAQGLVRAIERFAEDHAEERGRKTAIVFTKGFIQDDGLKADEQAIEAAQRANVALYFIDPRGLVAGHLTYRFDGFQPQMKNAPVARNSAGDVAMSGAGDVTDGVAFGAAHNLDLAGALRMAELTGGTLARHNDLKGALMEMVDESSAYYLLGYASRRQADGRWHTLAVRVDRPSVRVRARRGYHAAEPAGEPH